jgi:hypothetical protein
MTLSHPSPVEALMVVRRSALMLLRSGAGTFDLKHGRPARRALTTTRQLFLNFHSGRRHGCLGIGKNQALDGRLLPGRDGLTPKEPFVGVVYATREIRQVS